MNIKTKRTSFIWDKNIYIFFTL